MVSRGFFEQMFFFVVVFFRISIFSVSLLFFFPLENADHVDGD